MSLLDQFVVDEHGKEVKATALEERVLGGEGQENLQAVLDSLANAFIMSEKLSLDLERSLALR